MFQIFKVSSETHLISNWEVSPLRRFDYNSLYAVEEMGLLVIQTQAAESKMGCFPNTALCFHPLRGRDPNSLNSPRLRLSLVETLIPYNPCLRVGPPWVTQLSLLTPRNFKLRRIDSQKPEGGSQELFLKGLFAFLTT